MKKNLTFVFSLALSLFCVAHVYAATIELSPGSSIQEAIDSASDGDTINLAAGEYTGDIDFKGKAISIVGVGEDSVIRGNGDEPVVSFTSGEGFSSLLDRVTVTGGNLMGGILIENSSPRVTRCHIVRNRSLNNGTGSGIYVTTTGDTVSAPSLFNNILFRNRRTKGSSGDPHGIYVRNSDPSIINNTIVRTDSNGIFVTGSSSPRISNNIIAYNGKGSRGRGICFLNVSDDDARLDHNLFFRNRKGAIFFNFDDSKKVSQAEAQIKSAFPNGQVTSNIDGNPRFSRLRRGVLSLRSNSPAVDAGDPDEALNDTDNSRNDIGAGGGSFSIFE